MCVSFSEYVCLVLISDRSNVCESPSLSTAQNEHVPSVFVFAVAAATAAAVAAPANTVNMNFIADHATTQVGKGAFVRMNAATWLFAEEQLRLANEPAKNANKSYFRNERTLCE